MLESGYIEELIEDNPWSPFPTINHTEKPDRAAAMLLEGRVAILVDGTPFVLTVPNLFVEYLQATEDYYERFIFTSAVRLLRFLAMLASLTLPALYVAVASFHYELMPTPILLSLAAQRESVPFPVLAEVLAMEIVFEVLREAGIRLPRPIGQAVSILAATLAGLSVALLVVTLSRRFPGQTLIEYAPAILGRLAGKAVGFLYVWWFLHMNALVIREFSTFLVTAVMPAIPIIVFSAIAAAVAAYAIYNGLEVLSRFNLLFSPVTLLLVIVFILSTKEMKGPALAEGRAHGGGGRHPQPWRAGQKGLRHHQAGKNHHCARI